MKKIITLILLSLPALALAQDKENNFSVALQTSSYKYTEPKMNLKGQMYGISAEYIGRPERSHIFVGLQGEFMTGSVKYTGGLWDGTPYTASGIRDYFVEGRFLLGGVIEVPKTPLQLWPYIGIASRFLHDGLGSVDYGYDRESQYTYSPIGIKIRAKFGHGFTAAFTGEYDFFWGGTQTSYIGRAIEVNQDDGYGARFGLNIAKKFNKVGVFVEPFYRYWNIEKSDYARFDAMYLVYEPKNDTKEYGIKIGINF